MGKACRTYVGDVKSIHSSGGKALGKEQLGKHKRRWENDVTEDLKK